MSTTSSTARWKDPMTMRKFSTTKSPNSPGTWPIRLQNSGSPLNCRRKMHRPSPILNSSLRRHSKFWNCLNNANNVQNKKSKPWTQRSRSSKATLNSSKHYQKDSPMQLTNWSKKSKNLLRKRTSSMTCCPKSRANSPNSTKKSQQ